MMRKAIFALLVILLFAVFVFSVTASADNYIYGEEFDSTENDNPIFNGKTGGENLFGLQEKNAITGLIVLGTVLVLYSGSVILRCGLYRRRQNEKI